jgi:beta-N-acetylhexosaminidase
LIREHGELVARAVKAFGFNTTLAPVLDLALPESAEVMGTRAAAQRQQEWWTMRALSGRAGRARRSGLRQAFSRTRRRRARFAPGDSGDPAQRARTLARKTWPLSRTAQRVADGDGEPRGLSRYAGQGTARQRVALLDYDVLRKRIGYRGIIFSDDLEMGGILKFMPIEEAAVAAIRAGMDLMEICHSPELILRAYEALIAEGERSAAFRQLLLARAAHGAAAGAELFAAAFQARFRPTIRGAARADPALREKIAKAGRH